MIHPHLKTLLTTFFIGILLTACNTLDSEFKVVRGQAISEAEMQNVLNELGIPGLSIAVIDDFEIDWAQGYGVKNVETNEPVSESTLFQAASISKPVAALGALHLVEEGQLDLDADIRDYLTSWEIPDRDNKLKGKHISLRHLLTHSAGLTVHGFAGYEQDEPLPTVLEILNGTGPANSAAVQVDREPGTGWRYSGGGYVVLQRLMENVTGMDFADYMEASVLAPLSMDSSSFVQPLPEEQWSAAAAGHGSFGGAIAGDWHVYPELAAAGLWTTASDLANMIIDIQLSVQNESNKVLSKEMTQAFLSPQIEEWGLGVGLDISEATFFFHDGGNEGFRTLFIANAEAGQGIVLMMNSDRGDSLFEPLVEKLARAYDW